MNFISFYLSAFVGGCIDCKNMHDMNKIKKLAMRFNGCRCEGRNL